MSEFQKESVQRARESMRQARRQDRIGSISAKMLAAYYRDNARMLMKQARRFDPPNP